MAFDQVTEHVGLPGALRGERRVVGHREPVPTGRPGEAGEQQAAERSFSAMPCQCVPSRSPRSEPSRVERMRTRIDTVEKRRVAGPDDPPWWIS